MGFCYETGLGVECDPKKSKKIYKTALNPRSFPEVDLFKKIEQKYDMTRTVSTLISEAVKDLKESAELGYGEAMLALGNIYTVGTMTGTRTFRFNQNGKTLQYGVEMLNKALHSGCTDAQFTLAMLYAQGIGVKQDLQTAILMCSNAYQARVNRFDATSWDLYKDWHLDVFRDCCQRFEATTEPSQAHQFYRDMAEGGSELACLRLGDIFLTQQKQISPSLWIAYDNFQKVSHIHDMFLQNLSLILEKYFPDSDTLKLILQYVSEHSSNPSDEAEDSYGILKNARKNAKNIKPLIDLKNKLNSIFNELFNNSSESLEHFNNYDNICKVIAEYSIDCFELFNDHIKKIQASMNVKYKDLKLTKQQQLSLRNEALDRIHRRALSNRPMHEMEHENEDGVQDQELNHNISDNPHYFDSENLSDTEYDLDDELAGPPDSDDEIGMPAGTNFSEGNFDDTEDQEFIDFDVADRKMSHEQTAFKRDLGDNTSNDSYPSTSSFQDANPQKHTMLVLYNKQHKTRLAQVVTMKTENRGGGKCLIQ